VAPVALDRVVRDAVEVASLARRAPIDVVLPAEVPAVDGVASELVQVLVDVLTNAVDASPPSAPVTVTLRAAGGEAELAVEDRGSGMSADVKARLFEPFFTTKEPGRGTGLGLSIVYSLVQAHRGRIDVETTAGKGTRVSIWLPLSGA
jgi:signal transduction histidine kinase